MNKTEWSTLASDECLQTLQSDPNGLSEVEATKRRSNTGPNELETGHGVSVRELLLAQFKNTLILILLGATVVSLLLGHTVESIVITVIVLFAVSLGFIQEYRAERAIDALRRMAAPSANVLRAGVEMRIPARDLVPGDLIVLRTGDRVPADARVIESINLQADEALLTGESLPSSKHSDSLVPAQTIAPGDRHNMLHAGTSISYGRGRAVVVAIGMETEFGRIASLLKSVETGATPLQQNLDKVGSVLGWVACVVIVLIVGAGWMRGQPFFDMLIFGVALAVAVVPEALPAVVTISLALGVRKMVQRNALIRRLPAVETLGSTSVICTDKTGTLTRGEMTVRRLYAGGESFDVSGAGYARHGEFCRTDGRTLAATEAITATLTAAILASDAELSGAGTDVWTIKGDPTEAALLVAAAKAGLHRATVERDTPRVAEFPFTAESKRMTTLHRSGAGLIAYSKGAPEVIVANCLSWLTPRGNEALDQESRTAILHQAQQMAGAALRVLAIARQPEATAQSSGSGMEFLGLVGMLDPPRPEAKAAIAVCVAAGIRPVMMTGDHPLTAQAVARELDLQGDGRVITGSELEQMSDAELRRDIERISVYARVSPAHKLRIVDAWQARGHIAAMTGDGVNDAPALKKADIGIAMGIAGTDVTREAAAMTLLDDNFASIVAAVEEGRGVFGNIKKYLMYLLSSNIGEIGLMAGATLLGLPLPLTAVQILYVNLATDGLPALALAVDPPEPDLMQRPPRNPRTGIFTRPVVILMGLGGLWSTLVNLGLFAWTLQSGRAIEEAMTMSFVSLVLIQFVKAYNFRSDRVSVWHQPFANKWLNRAISWELLLLLLIVYLPVLHQPFRTYALSLQDWLIVAGTAFTVAPILECAKWMARRGWLGKLDGS